LTPCPSLYEYILTYMNIQWNENYSSGINLLDLQHKELVKNINNFLCLDIKKKKITECKKLIKLVDQFIKVHFKDEEDIMKKIKYDDIKTHEKRHNMLKAELNLFKSQFKRKPLDKIVVLEFSSFLSSWLNDHLYTEDMKLIKYIRENYINV